MGFFFVVGYFITTIIIMISIFQFLSSLLREKNNTLLLKISEKLSCYSHQIDRFLTFNTDKKPFPFYFKTK